MIWSRGSQCIATLHWSAGTVARGGRIVGSRYIATPSAIGIIIREISRGRNDLVAGVAMYRDPTLVGGDGGAERADCRVAK